MDRILIILKKENGPRASSAPVLGLNTIIFKHVYWYMQQTQVSVYRTIGPLVDVLFFCLHFQHFFVIILVESFGFWSGSFFLIAPFLDHCLLLLLMFRTTKCLKSANTIKQTRVSCIKYHCSFDCSMISFTYLLTLHFSWLEPELRICCLAHRGSTGVLFLLWISCFVAQGSQSPGSLLYM